MRKESTDWWVVIHWDKYPVILTLSANRGATLRKREKLFEYIFPYSWKGVATAKVVRATIFWEE